MNNYEIKDTSFSGEMEMNATNFLWTCPPPGLLIYICDYLGLGDLRQLRLVCKLWRNITHHKFKQKSKLIINRSNMATFKNIVQNDEKFLRILAYDSVEINGIKRSDDLPSILKSLGPKIHRLGVYKCSGFDILYDCMPQLEELTIENVPTRKYLVSFDPSKLKAFKSLDIKGSSISTAIANDLTIKLKKLCLNVLKKHQEIVINILQFHSDSLKHLELDFAKSIIANPDSILQWKQTFSMFRNLGVLKIRGRICEEWLCSIINALPKTTPLRYFYTDEFKTTDWYNLFIGTWLRRWPSLQLVGYLYLTDPDNTDLAILRQTLRNFVIPNGRINFIRVEELLKIQTSETNNILKARVRCDLEYPRNNILKMFEFVQRLPRLVHLKIVDFEEFVDDTVLSSIFRYQLQLQHLHLHKCPKITDKSLMGFGINPAPITNLKGLQTLSLAYCRHITDLALIKCFKFIELRELAFFGLKQISSAGIKELTKNCPALEKLKFDRCSRIDDDSILYIAQGLPRLRELSVISERVTRKSIDYIEKFCKSLKMCLLFGDGIDFVDWKR